MANHPAVTVYTQPGCMPCRYTMRALDDRAVTYTTVDVTQDDAARRYITDTLKHTSVPVVVVDTAHGVEPAHWAGLQPGLINEHFGPRIPKVAA